MTVQNLMNLLTKMDPNAVVVFPDTYAQDEGWWDGHEDAVMTVDGAVADGGRVVLTGTDWDEEDEDEDEEDE